MDVFDAKRDTVQTIVEAGFSKNKLIIKDQAPSYYHPGKSGSVFLSTEEDKPISFFGEIHPNIVKKLDIKIDALIGFEIYLDYFKETNKKLKEAVLNARSVMIPENYIQRVIQFAKQGFKEIEFKTYDTDWDSEAYLTVSGQNSNNSIRVTNDFLKKVENNSDWELIRRTDGKVFKLSLIHI